MRELERFYIQWATVCWQVRDRETQQAVAFHKTESKAKADARVRNSWKDSPDGHDQG